MRPYFRFNSNHLKVKMKLNFDRIVYGYDGKPVVHGVEQLKDEQGELVFDERDQPVYEKTGKPWTLLSVAETALLEAVKGDENLSGKDKAKMGKLMQKIWANQKSCELDIKEEISLLEERIGKLFTPKIVSFAIQMLYQPITESPPSDPLRTPEHPEHTPDSY